MPTPTVDLAFKAQFESESHAYFQRRGSKLSNSVRTRKGVAGKSTTFQTYGVAEAVQKTRHGDVPQSHPNHAPVECLLQDWYVQIPIDKLDLTKLDNDEREQAIIAGSAAMGQKVDDIIITNALSQTTRFVGNYATGLTHPILRQGIEKYWETDVPEDGESYGVLSNHAWQEFKAISQVSSADYVGELYPWLKGRKAFNYEDIIWMPHTGLPLANTDDRDNYLYHKSAVGVAWGDEITTDWFWDGRAQCWLVTMKMSVGAVLIDERGVVELRLDDDTAIS